MRAEERLGRFDRAEEEEEEVEEDVDEDRAPEDLSSGMLSSSMNIL